jgi:hypothetical protein
VALAVLARLWRKYRRLRIELVEARRQADEWAALAALCHETNYRLSCRIYGKTAVDKAIADAHDKGTN